MKETGNYIVHFVTRPIKVLCVQLQLTHGPEEKP